MPSFLEQDVVFAYKRLLLLLLLFGRIKLTNLHQHKLLRLEAKRNQQSELVRQSIICKGFEHTHDESLSKTSNSSFQHACFCSRSIVAVTSFSDDRCRMTTEIGGDTRVSNWASIGPLDKKGPKSNHIDYLRKWEMMMMIHCTTK